MNRILVFSFTKCVIKLKHKFNFMVGDAAYLVEHWTGTLLTLVRFPGAARDFSPESTFSVDSLTVSVKPHVQLHAFTSVCMLKIPQSMSEFGGLWKH